MMMKDALAKSINSIAVKVSLDVGREKVMANMVKFGITHLKKTCSLALGDQGMTPLEHVGNWTVFAAAALSLIPMASRRSEPCRAAMSSTITSATSLRASSSSIPR